MFLFLQSEIQKFYTFLDFLQSKDQMMYLCYILYSLKMNDSIFTLFLGLLRNPRKFFKLCFVQSFIFVRK